MIKEILSQLKALNEKIDEQNNKLDYLCDVLDEVASTVEEENDIASCLLDDMFHAHSDEDEICEDDEDFEGDEDIEDFEEDDTDCSKCDVEDCNLRREPYEGDDKEEEESEAVADYRESLLDVAERLLEILRA